MSKSTKLAAARALCLAAALGLLQSAAFARVGAQEGGAAGRRLTVTGTVIGIGGRFAGRSRPFTLTINGYTSDADVRRLNETLRSGGQDELLRALSDMSAGRIQVGNNVGLPANAVIASRQPDGGTRIVVLFERNITFYEQRYGARSQDYRFGYAEVYVGRDGRGEGTFIPAARVRLRDGDTWEVEDFGVFPARIMGVRLRGGPGRAR